MRQWGEPSRRGSAVPFGIVRFAGSGPSRAFQCPPSRVPSGIRAARRNWVPRNGRVICADQIPPDPPSV